MRLLRPKNNMKKILLFTILLLSPFFLTGCGNDKTTIQSNQPSPDKTTEQPQTVKQLPLSKNQNPAYVYCESQSYELIIRFDKTSQSSKAYCRFPDTTECVAQEFMQGTCKLGQGSKLYYPDASNDEYENCPQTYEPVCTENNITFTNQCIAQKQKAVIIYTGPCIKEEETTINYIETNQEKTEIIEDAPTEISLPDWLPILTDLITSEPANEPAAFVEKCIYGTTVVYYQSAGCIDCYNTLYNTNGEVICFPNNDTTASCPSYFDQKNRKYYCEQIWIDTR